MLEFCQASNRGESDWSATFRDRTVKLGLKIRWAAGRQDPTQTDRSCSSQ